MMNSGISIIFMDKYKAKFMNGLSKEIYELAKKYEDIGINSINIPEHINEELDQIILVDMQWAELILEDKFLHERYLMGAIFKLNKWIDTWIKAESTSAGLNRNLIEDLIITIREVRTRLLGVMIWRKPRGIEEDALNDREIIKPALDKIQKFADTLYDASSNSKNFEIMVFHGKRDFFKTNCWPASSNSLRFEVFFGLFQDDFHLFLKDGINQIYKNELKKALILEDTVSFMDLNRIYNYFFGSYTNLIKILNRNYQYSLIEKALNAQETSYEALQKSVNTSLKPLLMTITNCPFSQLIGKQFKLGSFGLVNSPRYCEDKLVIFGNDNHEEFTADISLPNTRGIEGIFAFIYINHFGYYLVDISKNALIKFRMKPNEPITLVEGMIIIFAKMFAYEVAISDPILFSGRKVTTLTLIPVWGCKEAQRTGPIDISPDKGKLAIGRNRECNLSLLHLDISQWHAECFFDEISSEWKLRDLGSQNGTFYKLKNLAQYQEFKPSKALELKAGIGFLIENFYFYISNDED